MLIAPGLHQDIDDVAVLIDSPPEVLQLAVDFQEKLIEMPSITEVTLPPLQFPGVVRTKLLTPVPNRFVGKVSWPYGPPPTMKRLALDRGDARPENRDEEDWPFI